MGTQILLFGRNFPPLCRGKGYNRNLTRNSVADAKMPSIFPNFSKFFLISQNPRTSEKCRVASFFEARILEEKKLRISHTLYEINFGALISNIYINTILFFTYYED